MIQILLIGWVVLALIMTVLWWRQTQTHNATSVDVAWSAGLLILALLFGFTSSGDVARRIFVGAMASIWAARLALHLYTDRVARSNEEDGRYKALRSHWGSNANRNFFFFYQGQALVAVLFGIPVLAAMQGGSLSGLDLVAALVWLAAVTGESIADRQLARFRAEPQNKGKVCDTGLWRYSRHPNYFFEWVHWWTYVIAGRGSLLSWIGPAVMWLFLFRLTGIPYTEMQSVKSRGDAYRRYQQTTSVFVPWFPKEKR